MGSHRPAPSTNNDLHPVRAHRVIASLNREQLDFLDKLGKDALFSSGVKLSRTQILSAVVNVLRRCQLTGTGIHNPEQFEQRMIEFVAKWRGGKSHA